VKIAKELGRRRKRRRYEEVNRYVNGANEKNCVTCGEWKPRAEFGLCSPYLQARCRLCMRVYNRDYRRKERITA
jgi:hypothetical protein